MRCPGLKTNALQDSQDYKKIIMLCSNIYWVLIISGYWHIYKNQPLKTKTNHKKVGKIFGICFSLIKSLFGINGSNPVEMIENGEYD